jgi:O-antigen/teichoic acid export membrane protein
MDPLKQPGSDRSQRRTLLGAIIAVAVAIVVVSVVILIAAKGVGAALPAIFGGTIFTAVLALYWLRGVSD